MKFCKCFIDIKKLVYDFVIIDLQVVIVKLFIYFFTLAEIIDFDS